MFDPCRSKSMAPNKLSHGIDGERGNTLELRNWEWKLRWEAHRVETIRRRCRAVQVLRKSASVWRDDLRDYGKMRKILLYLGPHPEPDPLSTPCDPSLVILSSSSLPLSPFFFPLCFFLEFGILNWFHKFKYIYSSIPII